MTPELILSLAGFCFASTMTPGPNNMMLMASGVNFGFRRTIPHMAGISLGHSGMCVVLGLGLAGVFHAVPALSIILKVLATGYMLWLAYKIATAAPPGDAVVTGQPLTFLQSASFQWINPKAVAMALSAASLYAPTGDVRDVAMIGGMFFLASLPSTTVWTALGQGLRRLLVGRRLRLFNGAMALALVASLYPILRG
ncbi:MAG: LysE family translocator [Rhodobacteraceae bacterium]|nr:LysE family translocator [Paracoccaceae bacterium]